MLGRMIRMAAALAVTALGVSPAAAVQYRFDDTNTIPATTAVANSRVVFDVQGTSLTITLSNYGISSGGNGSLLTGVMFSTGSAVQTIADTTPVATAAYSWGGTTFSTNVDNTNKWVFVSSATPTVAMPAGQQYGLSTTAAGTFFPQALFPGGSSGADDYSLVGSKGCTTSGTAGPVSSFADLSATNCGANSGNKYPEAVGDIVFNITLTAAFVVNAATFLYTSSGASLGTGTPIVVSAPEPISLALFAPAVIGLAALRRRRK